MQTCWQKRWDPMPAETSSEIVVQRGLPGALRPQAARLYWLAFGGKLGLVMGPESRALRYLEATLRADHAFVALQGDRLVGIAGFKTPSGSFAGGTLAEMRAAYGVIGAAWRSWLLSRLSQEVDNRRFLIDGICVAPDQRGRGIGSLLIEALCDEGLRRGYEEIRLEVIDTNWRARSLYARRGFAVVKSEPIGLLRWIFGFAAATTMVRRLV